MFSIAIPTDKFHTRNSVRADEIAASDLPSEKNLGATNRRAMLN